MRKTRLATSVLAIVLVVAACAGPAATRAPTVAPATRAPATPALVTPAPATPTIAAPTAGMTAGAGEALVMLATSDLGEIVVDSAGRTLYGFLPDEASGEPTCYDDCAAAWPPLITTSEEIAVGEGLDATAFTAVARTDDAGDQVKFGSWPLYYFASDTAPGQTNGQGVGDNWFVVGADGELITE